MNKILHYLKKFEEYLRNRLIRSPYSRCSCEQKYSKPHEVNLLNIPTSDGLGQAVHPDVIFINSGFGEEKWKYIMAVTPYPFYNNKHENPELFVSHDGIFWKVPKGLINPIVPTPSERSNFNSDPCVFLHENCLFLYFKMTKKIKNLYSQDIIYMMKSHDGIVWSQPTEVLSSLKGHLLLSPSVSFIDGHFRIWTVEGQASSGLQVFFRDSMDGIKWGNKQLCEIIGLANNLLPWHIHVLVEENIVHLTLASSTSFSGQQCELHYGYSDNGGTSFLIVSDLIKKYYNFEEHSLYRGCLTKHFDYKNLYDLWFSGFDKNGISLIARTRVIIQNHMVHAL